MATGGQKLRVLREKLGLTMRDIETASERIARKRENEEYLVPISRLSDFETKRGYSEHLSPMLPGRHLPARSSRDSTLVWRRS